MQKTGKSPKLIINLFRHGSRGPLRSQDPYWKGLEGKLTDFGRAQHYVLGASLIQRYPHLRDTLKNNERILLRSTEFSRTQESLENHLLGMYEANEIPVDDLYIYHHNFAHEVQKHKIYQNFLNRDKKKVKLILTKMDVVPFEHDMEMLVTEVKTCPNTLALLGKDNEELLESRIQPVCEKIYKDTGIKLDGLGLRFFYDDLLADRYEGRSLPKGVTDESWDYIKRAGEYYVIFKRFGSETQRKLFPIFLLNRILELLKDSADNKLPYELVLMSAHDVTMFNFLNALKILTPEDLYNRLLDGKDLLYDFPNFASQLLIELWETDDTKEMLVRILYENKILKLGEKQEEFYSLSRLEELFKASYHPYTERDVYGHCGRQYVERAPKEVI